LEYLYSWLLVDSVKPWWDRENVQGRGYFAGYLSTSLWLKSSTIFFLTLAITVLGNILSQI
jgi:hypothetical protein